MKKILIVFFLILAFGAFGCAKKETKPTDDTAKKTDGGTVKKEDPNKQGQQKPAAKSAGKKAEADQGKGKLLNFFIDKNSGRDSVRFIAQLFDKDNVKGLENMNLIILYKEKDKNVNKTQAFEFDKDSESYKAATELPLKKETRNYSDLNIQKISVSFGSDADKKELELKVRNDMTIKDNKQVITKIAIPVDKIELAGLGSFVGEKIAWSLENRKDGESLYSRNETWGGGFEITKEGNMVVNLKEDIDKIMKKIENLTDKKLYLTIYFDEMTEGSKQTNGPWKLNEEINVLPNVVVSDSVEVEIKE